MSKNEHFLRPEDFLNFNMDLYTNINLIKINPLLFMAQHDNNINNLEQISIQGLNIPEIAYISDQLLDNPSNVGKYFCLNDNCITFIVAKDKINSIQDAKNYIFGIYVLYQMKVLQYNSNEPVYVMTTKTSDGKEININTGSTLPILMNKINVLDENLDINTIGYFEHKIRRLIQ